MRDASVFQHARVEPFADQSKQHPVSHPTLERFPQMSVADRIERDDNRMPTSTIRLIRIRMRSR
jgi:hypothetical protein